MKGNSPIKARVFALQNIKTQAYYVEQAYPAIPMIQHLIQCALNYSKTPTFKLISHNGTGYDHFYLRKDLAQFERITDYEVRYNKIRAEGSKARYAEITISSPTARVMVSRLVDSFKFIGCASSKFPDRFKLSWRKGDITSTLMSEYNTMDAVILYYGWAKFSATAYEET